MTDFDSCATVAQPLPQPLARLSKIADPETFRLYLRLGSLSQLGCALGRVHPNGHGGRPFDKSTVLRWETRERVPTPETLEAYRRIAQEVMADATAGRAVIRAHFGVRRWKFTAFAVCACGREFRLESVRQVQCHRCTRKNGGRR